MALGCGSGVDVHLRQAGTGGAYRAGASRSEVPAAGGTFIGRSPAADLPGFIPSFAAHSSSSSSSPRPRRPGCRPPHEAAALTAELALTLHRVHAHGVCHRDVKPANVLIDTADRPRVVDFGLALLDEPWGPSAPPGDAVAGTLAYMAPEQANAHAERIGPRTDVFGLGAVLYHLLTGRPPYDGPDRDALWRQARDARITPPHELNPRVPRALERICQKALAADRKDRYASCAALARALVTYQRRRRLRWDVGLVDRHA